MRRAQVIVCESGGSLAEQLRLYVSRNADAGWWLREVSHADGCPGLLRPGEASVLVLKVGRDLERELTMLEAVSRRYPDTACVVVGEGANPALAALAWDLGARYVVFLPQSPEQLGEVVAALLGVQGSRNAPSPQPLSPRGERGWGEGAAGEVC